MKTYRIPGKQIDFPSLVGWLVFLANWDCFTLIFTLDISLFTVKPYPGRTVGFFPHVAKSSLYSVLIYSAIN